MLLKNQINNIPYSQISGLPEVQCTFRGPPNAILQAREAIDRIIAGDMGGLEGNIFYILNLLESKIVF